MEDGCPNDLAPRHSPSTVPGTSEAGHRFDYHGNFARVGMPIALDRGPGVIRRSIIDYNKLPWIRAFQRKYPFYGFGELRCTVSRAYHK